MKKYLWIMGAVAVLMGPALADAGCKTKNLKGTWFITITTWDSTDSVLLAFPCVFTFDSSGNLTESASSCSIESNDIANVTDSNDIALDSSCKLTGSITLEQDREIEITDGRINSDKKNLMLSGTWLDGDATDDSLVGQGIKE